MSAASEGATGLAGRYASALFELAEEARALDAIAADLKGLVRLTDESADFRRLIRSPVIGRDAQQRAVAAILEAAGAHALTRNFLGTIVRNRRLFALPTMAATFLDLLAKRRGEVTADVISAADLKDDQRARLTEALRKLVGAEVALKTRTDPGLLGGLVVKVGSRMVDSSIRTKLQRLGLAMKGVA